MERRRTHPHPLGQQLDPEGVREVVLQPANRASDTVVDEGTLKDDVKQVYETVNTEQTPLLRRSTLATLPRWCLRSGKLDGWTSTDDGRPVAYE
ncbi:hypothetical protein K2Y11_03095 [bacterium]|nr:hypothetical protein [bacterium]